MTHNHQHQWQLTTHKKIASWTERQKQSRAIDMIFYWVRNIIRQNRFHILWKGGKKKLADYVTKHHPVWYHRTIQPIYLKPTKKYIENSKYRKTGTRGGCAVTNNPGVTLKPDNPLKRIRNTIPRKPDNTLKVIRNIVPNGIWIQWPRVITIPT